MAGVAPPSPQKSIHGGLFSPLARGQYAALVRVQTRMFVNSLRTKRGSFELGAHILVFLIFSLIACGPAFGLGFGAWVAVTHGRILGISVLLWVLFLAWQFFAALAPALGGQNPELSHLLRYPVSFGSWIVLYLVYGLAAPSTLIGIIWATAIGIGISIARPDLFLWTACTLALFIFFNLLLARMILAWIERWLAQRRTREIVTAIFLFLALAAQVFNPAYRQNPYSRPLSHVQSKTANRVASRFMEAQKVFPPGLVINSINLRAQHRPLQASEDFLWLGVYTFGAGALLALRLRSESRGENLSDAPRRSTTALRKVRRRPALDFSGPLFSGPIAAVFEKDLRYLMRSGPMLYNLAAPLVMVFLFGGMARGGQFSGVRSRYALPIGMVWAFFGLARLICNNLGMEGDGIQFYFLSPTPMRTVVLSKNALHFVLFLLEIALISAVVVFRFGLPSPSMATDTLAWLIFAVPANFAVGNLLSITMPYRINMTRIRRETGALGNGLTSLITQLGLVAVGALVLVPCALMGHSLLAAPVFLALAAISLFVYWRVLGNVNRMVQSRQESLTLEIMKTT
jgi:ABC-2 type transport system permease protein